MYIKKTFSKFQSFQHSMNRILLGKKQYNLADRSSANVKEDFRMGLRSSVAPATQLRRKNPVSGQIVEKRQVIFYGRHMKAEALAPHL